MKSISQGKRKKKESLDNLSLVWYNKGIEKRGENIMKSETTDKILVATMVAVGLFQISVVGLAFWLMIKLIKYFG